MNDRVKKSDRDRRWKIGKKRTLNSKYSEHTAFWYLCRTQISKLFLYARSRNTNGKSCTQTQAHTHRERGTHTMSLHKVVNVFCTCLKGNNIIVRKRIGKHSSRFVTCFIQCQNWNTIFNRGQHPNVFLCTISRNRMKNTTTSSSSSGNNNNERRGEERRNKKSK